ncbi:MAG: hypothetical protein ACXWUG_09545 [Polyangiales bacterium]
MSRSLVFAVSLGLAACSPSKPAVSGPVQVASSEAVADPPARCPVPKAIVAVADPGAQLAADPLEDSRWQRDPSAITIGDRTYAMDAPPSTDLVASRGGHELWRAKGAPVAGGGFTVLLSPHHGVVGRDYSRGGVDLFDAISGDELGVAGTKVVVSPDDRYALDPPTITFGAEKLTHPDVLLLPLHPKGKPISVMAPPPGGVPTKLSASICATGETFAVSHPGGELVIFRFANLSRAASLASPGPGRPVFSRSGKLVALVEDVDAPPKRVFALQ